MLWITKSVFARECQRPRQSACMPFDLVDRLLSNPQILRFAQDDEGLASRETKYPLGIASQVRDDEIPSLRGSASDRDNLPVCLSCCGLTSTKRADPSLRSDDKDRGSERSFAVLRMTRFGARSFTSSRMTKIKGEILRCELYPLGFQDDKIRLCVGASASAAICRFVARETKYPLGIATLLSMTEKS